MVEPVWIHRSALDEMHRRCIERDCGIHGIRDERLLESALACPRNKWAYEDADLPQLAAAYAFGLTKNHPFLDGNKRIAFAVLGSFLEVNGYSLEADKNETRRVMTKLAAGELSEEALSQWIRAHIVSYP